MYQEASSVYRAARHRLARAYEAEAEKRRDLLQLWDAAVGAKNWVSATRVR